MIEEIIKKRHFIAIAYCKKMKWDIDNLTTKRMD